MQFHQALKARWQRIEPARRTLWQCVAWLVLAVLLAQLSWIPGQQRLRQAEQRLSQELMLSERLQQISVAPLPAPRQALSPAALNEHAQAAGLRIGAMQIREQRVELTVGGAADAVMRWLHALELDGVQLSEVQLQVAGDVLSARIVMQLQAS